MLNGWLNKDIIGYEGAPCNVQLIEMVENNDFYEGMMEYASHLMFIFLLLGNVCHLIYTPKKIIGHVKHPYHSEMHQELDVIGIET